MRDQIETWGDKEFEDCNMEGSLKGGKKKNVEAFRYCVRKQRVWKLPTFLLYCFVVTVAYLISFLLVFLSTQGINTDRTCLLRLRYLYISNFFFFFFFGAKLLCSIYINMRPFFFFFRLFVFVFILDEHPWHAIDVFVRFPECRFKNKRSCLCCSIVL